MAGDAGLAGHRREPGAARRPPSKSLLVYGVVQDERGRWQVIRHGHAPQLLDWRTPPPELLSRTDGPD
ncbi:hypothetical protein [Microvirga subterranea]|uniref:hypothetical protein n=1 Tax=Microvirga subterranea TaxID=186651 RepID=UPI000E0B8845|nr:hypothetical protein [Microvirga subterranea]